MTKGDFKDRGAPLGGGGLGAKAYFGFALVSSAFRSYEAGIVSSQMPTIKTDLHLSYTSEGIAAAASDYGLLPSGLIAIFVLTRLPPHDVLRTVYLLIAGLTLICVFRPSFGMFVTTRALTSFLWGMAAVHYPAWVNAHGSKEGKTMQLAVLNAIMLGGILLGYLVGGIDRSLGGVRWAYLYGVEAVLMGVCAIIACFFDRSLAQASRAEGNRHGDAEDVAFEHGNTGATECTPLDPRRRIPQGGGGGLLPQELRALLTCPLYVFSVAISSTISGVVGFILYFMTQVAEDAIGFNKASINAVVAVVFIFGPVTGNIGGGWVLSKFGGYQNYVPAFRLVLLWVFLALAFSALLPVAAAIRSPPLFTVGIFGLLLFGAAPIAAINGAAVNAVPGNAAATFGSGVQFFCQHGVKMLAPIVGGWVIDAHGLGAGFSIVIMAMGLVLNLFALGAYWAARNHSDSPALHQTA